MTENQVIIRISQRYEYPLKILGITIPVHPSLITNGNISLGDGRSFRRKFEAFGLTSPCFSLDCLVDILIDVEMSRNGKPHEKPLGPITAIFEHIEDKGELRMKKMLEIYARSEQTTVTFEKKEYL